jgi:succinoglycan biosynthesis transport protein ExoP
MSESIGTLLAPSPSLSPARKLADPADFQRPLMYYVGVVRQHLGKIALVSIALTILGIAVCALLPEVNAGTSEIAVDRQAQPERVGDDKLLTTGDDQFMATQMNLLQADSVLRPVAEKYNLLEREHQLSRYMFWRYSPEKERMIREAPIKLKKLKIQREPNTYILSIMYKDRDPKVAADVANAIADSYLQNIFATRMKEAGRLTSSMEQQLLDLKQKMEASHLALMKYQKELGTADPEQKTSILVAKLQALNTEYSAAEGDRISKESTFHATRNGNLPSQQATDLAKEIEAANAARANLALVASTYGTEHPEYRKAAAQVQDAEQTVEINRQQIVAHTGVDYHQAEMRERMLSQAVTDTKRDVDDLTARSFEYTRLKHEADSAEVIYQDLFSKIKQAGINSELQNNVIRLADAARPSAKPIFPNWFLMVPVCLVLFAGLSTFYFVSRDLTDESVKDPLHIQHALGVRVICTLPKVDGKLLRLVAPNSTLRSFDGHAPSLDSGFFFEGVRHLRSYMTLAPGATGRKSVLVTSALPGEGKSTIALSLAMAQAEQGKRTLLIDADLRQSTLEKLLQLDRQPGISDFVTGKRELGGLYRAVPGTQNLFLLGSGTAMPLPISMLGARINEMLEHAYKEFDAIVVDSPPLLGCAETLDLAVATDATLLAARSGVTSMGSLRLVMETLSRVNVHVAGVVLNQSSTIASDKTYKAYRRYYTALRSA